MVAAVAPGHLPLSPVIAPDANDNWYNFDLLCLTPDFKIDLYYAIKSRFPNQQDLETLRTNEVAIQILKDIKFEADVRAFFTKPVVLIMLGLVTAGIGFLPLFVFPEVLIIGSFAIEIILGIVLGLVDGLLPSFFGFVLISSCADGTIPRISNAYDELSARVRLYIDRLESDPQFHIQLAGEYVPAIPLT